MHTVSLKLPNENFYTVIEWCLTVAIQIIWRDVSNNYIIDLQIKRDDNSHMYYL